MQFLFFQPTTNVHRIESKYFIQTWFAHKYVTYLQCISTLNHHVHYLFVTFKIFMSLANISQHHTQHVCSLHCFFNTCCFRTQPMCSISSDNETLKICLSEKSSVWVVATGCDPKAIWHWTDLTVFIRDFLEELEMANAECASLEKV